MASSLVGYLQSEHLATTRSGLDILINKSAQEPYFADEYISQDPELNCVLDLVSYQSGTLAKLEPERFAFLSLVFEGLGAVLLHAEWNRTWLIVPHVVSRLRLVFKDALDLSDSGINDSQISFLSVTLLLLTVLNRINGSSLLHRLILPFDNRTWCNTDPVKDKSRCRRLLRKRCVQFLLSYLQAPHNDVRHFGFRLCPSLPKLLCQFVHKDTSESRDSVLGTLRDLIFSNSEFNLHDKLTFLSSALGGLSFAAEKHYEFTGFLWELLHYVTLQSQVEFGNVTPIRVFLQGMVELLAPWRSLHHLHLLEYIVSLDHASFLIAINKVVRRIHIWREKTNFGDWQDIHSTHQDTIFLLLHALGRIYQIGKIPERLASYTVKDLLTATLGADLKHALNALLIDRKDSIDPMNKESISLTRLGILNLLTVVSKRISKVEEYFCNNNTISRRFSLLLRRHALAWLPSSSSLISHRSQLLKTLCSHDVSTDDKERTQFEYEFLLSSCDLLEECYGGALYSYVKDLDVLMTQTSDVPSSVLRRLVGLVMSSPNFVIHANTITSSHFMCKAAKLPEDVLEIFLVHIFSFLRTLEGHAAVASQSCEMLIAGSAFQGSLKLSIREAKQLAPLLLNEKVPTLVSALLKELFTSENLFSLENLNAKRNYTWEKGVLYATGRYALKHKRAYTSEEAFTMFLRSMKLGKTTHMHNVTIDTELKTKNDSGAISGDPLNLEPVTIPSCFQERATKTENSVPWKPLYDACWNSQKVFEYFVSDVLDDFWDISAVEKSSCLGQELETLFCEKVLELPLDEVATILTLRRMIYVLFHTVSQLSTRSSKKVLRSVAICLVKNLSLSIPQAHAGANLSLPTFPNSFIQRGPHALLPSDDIESISLEWGLRFSFLLLVEDCLELLIKYVKDAFASEAQQAPSDSHTTLYIQSIGVLSQWLGSSYSFSTSPLDLLTLKCLEKVTSEPFLVSSLSSNCIEPKPHFSDMEHQKDCSQASTISILCALVASIQLNSFDHISFTDRISFLWGNSILEKTLHQYDLALQWLTRPISFPSFTSSGCKPSATRFGKRDINSTVLDLRTVHPCLYASLRHIKHTTHSLANSSSLFWLGLLVLGLQCLQKDSRMMCHATLQKISLSTPSKWMRYILSWLASGMLRECDRFSPFSTTFVGYSIPLLCSPRSVPLAIHLWRQLLASPKFHANLLGELSSTYGFSHEQVHLMHIYHLALRMVCKKDVAKHQVLVERILAHVFHFIDRTFDFLEKATPTGESVTPFVQVACQILQTSARIPILNRLVEGKGVTLLLVALLEKLVDALLKKWSFTQNSPIFEKPEWIERCSILCNSGSMISEFLKQMISLCESTSRLSESSTREGSKMLMHSELCIVQSSISVLLQVLYDTKWTIECQEFISGLSSALKMVTPPRSLIKVTKEA